MTTTRRRNSKLVSKKVLVYAAIVVFASITLLTAGVSSEVLAQVGSSSSTGSKDTTSTPAKTTTTTTIAGIANQGNPLTNALPNITGSIPLGSTIMGAISSKVKTTLSDAVITAQKTVGSNSSATLAFIRPLNGYLVYDVHVRNNSNNTPYAVIVDPGNGKVLYKQALPSLSGSAGHPGMGPLFGGYKGGGGGYGCRHGMMMGPPSPHPGMGVMRPTPPR
jgi:hypothetical protein